ncbi:unnamed protein product [marine sediment metagenome]|uniref:Intein C-terminal splicing domain-containing protein n=1 Tax=marine sediment metagenome TaxID=412755 RepID=X0YXN6_9ZZZZ
MPARADAIDEYYLINNFLKVTALHPFLIVGPEELWKKASELRVGDRVKSVSGGIAIRSIKKVKMDEKINVHSFRVADSKNYLVGDENDGLYVVHNGL